jgi:DNA-binding transcriptional LysR family regulator
VELRHLRYFIAVAEELSFTRAAERLHIAQPPLSQQIRQLEASVGVKLLRRTSRRVQLTHAGGFFLEQAYQAMKSVDQAAVLAQRAERGEIGRLVVGFLEYTSYTLIPPILQAFRDRFPEVDVVLRLLPNTQQVNALRSGHVDVTLLRPPIDDDGISSELIFRETFMLAMPATHAMAKKRKVSIRDFAKDPFIMYPRELGPSFYSELYGLLGTAGFLPKVALEVSQIHTAVALVGAGIGVALVPQSTQRIVWGNVVYKPLAERPPDIDVVLAWQKKLPSPLIEAFRETSRKCVANRAEFSRTKVASTVL